MNAEKNISNVAVDDVGVGNDKSASIATMDNISDVIEDDIGNGNDNSTSVGTMDNISGTIEDDVGNVTIEQSILSVAERLFLERGFSLTTTTEIAKQVGCNQALIHYYFRTKEQLFQKVFEEKAKLFASTFLEIDKSNLPFLERVKRIIEAHFDILTRNPSMSFLLINELTTNPSRIESLRHNMGQFTYIIENLERDLEREIKKGNIRNITIIDLILNILSLNIGAFLMLPIIKNGLNVDDEFIEIWIKRRKKEVVDTVIRGLRA